MSKSIVLHDRFSNEPVVIRTRAISAVRKAFDRTADSEEEYSEVLLGSFFLSVKETIVTVITKIKQAESENKDADRN